MKLFLTVAIALSGISQTSIAKIVPADAVSEQTCAENLYIRLGTYMSSTQRACSYGRTDSEFQDCATLVARQFGDDYVEVAGQACALSRSLPGASCATELYLRGGLYVSNNSQSADGIRICALPASEEIKKCIVERYQSRQSSGLDAAKVCIEKFDPMVKARKEADLRRLAEQKRIEEQRRAEEQRRQFEAQQAAAEARKAEQAARNAEELRKTEEARRAEAALKADEARKIEEAKKAAEAQKIAEAKKAEEAKKSADAKKAVDSPKKKDPQPPKDSGSGGGVIVDLPNFE